MLQNGYCTAKTNEMSIVSCLQQKNKRIPRSSGEFKHLDKSFRCTNAQFLESEAIYFNRMYLAAPGVRDQTGRYLPCPGAKVRQIDPFPVKTDYHSLLHHHCTILHSIRSLYIATGAMYPMYTGFFISRGVLATGPVKVASLPSFFLNTRLRVIYTIVVLLIWESLQLWWMCVKGLVD